MSLGALKEEIYIISKNGDLQTDIKTDRHKDRQTWAVHRVASQLIKATSKQKRSIYNNIKRCKRVEFKCDIWRHQENE